ncbi:MAG TPA: T9SS type A sorting domain-containing protein [Rhodothermales bacterium]|nr:T9SS type A sorting domain-containing protein [Rhodothermales bacterium]
MSRSLLLVFLAVLALPVARAQAPRVIVSPNAQANGHMGVATVGLPDVDGDGRGDYAVGAYRETVNAVTLSGRVYVYSGATGALIRTLVSPTTTSGNLFGIRLASVPDADNDGVADLLVGASGERVGTESNAGRAHLFSGATGTLLRTFASPTGADFGGQFGSSIAGTPDLSSDGRGDLLVGALGEDGAALGAGRAYLLSSTGATLRTLVSPNPVLQGSFGHAVAVVPDANGDGAADLLVGAYIEDVSSTTAAGRAYLFSGATGALLRPLVSPLPQPAGSFGFSMAGVPDVNGDGRGDLYVGAVLETVADSSGAGRVYLFSGSTGLPLDTLVSPAPRVNGYFGQYVSAVPDVNGDGVTDVLVSAAREARGNLAQVGRAYLFSGATRALLATVDTPNPEAEGIFGTHVAGVPDTDGDGRGDLLIGARQEDNPPLVNAGRAYLFSGRAATPAESGPTAAAGLTLQVAPNPAHGAAVVTLTLDAPETVTVAVYDALGRRVFGLLEGRRGAGTHTLALDTAGLPAGLYVVRAAAGGASVTRRLVVR